MSDYFDFHNKSIITRKFIRVAIQISTILPNKLFIYFWNTLLKLIKNSVRISLTQNNTFLVTDKYTTIEICYKKRFEYYLQNIDKFVLFREEKVNGIYFIEVEIKGEKESIYKLVIED